MVDWLENKHVCAQTNTTQRKNGAHVRERDRENPKTISRIFRTFKFQQRLKDISRRLPEINGHMPPRAEPIEENEKKKHARLPAQMPASRVSKNPGGNNGQEWMDAVSGREDRRHRADKRVGKTTKKKEEQTFMEKRNTWHNNVKASVDNPLADFATLPSAGVKVARA